MTLQAVHRVIDTDFPQHLEAIREIVRIPSVSAEGTGIREMAHKVREIIQALGGKAQLVPTQGNPIVFGTLDRGRPKTLLLYGMYDVMPANEPGWVVPPFGGDIAELDGLGECVVSRGICNSKGPLQATFNVIDAIQSVGDLPVNLDLSHRGRGGTGEPEPGAIRARFQRSAEGRRRVLSLFCP